MALVVATRIMCNGTWSGAAYSISSLSLVLSVQSGLAAKTAFGFRGSGPSGLSWGGLEGIPWLEGAKINTM